MKLYFLRHGAAEERRAGLADAHRRLTEEGITEMRAAARGMAALDLRFDAILHSPLRRARETAEIAAAVLGCPALLAEEPGLACGCGLRELVAMLGDRDQKARVLLVGHEPDFSELVSLLTGGGRVRMKKAALACVDTHALAPGAGELRWLLEPEHLAAAGRPAPAA